MMKFSGSLKIVLAVLVALLEAGCQSARPIQFGIYSVPEKDLGTARAMGMDFVVGPKFPDYLASAQRAGLKVIGREGKVYAHKALLGCYLSDEPDLFGTPPSSIAMEYKAAKQRSKSPIFLNLSSGYSIELYGEHCDIVMFDWYPIGWMPIETFYSNARVARLAARTKPFFAVIQAFDWQRYPALMPASANNRSPTAVEIKAMAVWAAMNGASGIAFYPFNDGTTDITQYPERSKAIEEAVSLIKEHQDWFAGSRAWAPYPFNYEDRRDQYTTTAEPSIGARFVKMPGAPQKYWVVAANLTDRVIRVTESKRVDVDGTDGTIVFMPFEIKFLTAALKTK
jgi:hypothetical protein